MSTNEAPVSRIERIARIGRNTFATVGAACIALYSEVPNPVLVGVGLNSLAVAATCQLVLMRCEEDSNSNNAAA